MAGMFLIEKRGLYYRPNSSGYTGLKREAGRYPFDEAAIHAGPNGPDGSTDGMGIWREAEAPQFSTLCPYDVRQIENIRLETLRETQLAIRAACNEAVRSATSAYVQGIAKGYDRSDAVIAALFHQYSGTNHPTTHD